MYYQIELVYALRIDRSRINTTTLLTLVQPYSQLFQYHSNYGLLLVLKGRQCQKHEITFFGDEDNPSWTSPNWHEFYPTGLIKSELEISPELTSEEAQLLTEMQTRVPTLEPEYHWYEIRTILN